MLKDFDKMPELNSAWTYFPTMSLLALPAKRNRRKCAQMCVVIEEINIK